MPPYAPGAKIMSEFRPFRTSPSTKLPPLPTSYCSCLFQLLTDFEGSILENLKVRWLPKSRIQLIMDSRFRILGVIWFFGFLKIDHKLKQTKPSKDDSPTWLTWLEYHLTGLGHAHEFYYVIHLQHCRRTDVQLCIWNHHEHTFTFA